MRTVTLAEQMQVIFDKMPEPTVIDAECEVLDDDQAGLMLVLQEAHADDEANEWRRDALLQDFEERGGVDALRDMLCDDFGGDSYEEDWEWADELFAGCDWADIFIPVDKRYDPTTGEYFYINEQQVEIVVTPAGDVLL